MTDPVIIGDATRIYALVEPLDYGVPRYIGKTIQPLVRRLIAHKRAAKRGGTLPVHYWLRKAMPIHFGPAIRWIETVPAGEDWAARERHWIAEARRAGHSILNLTDGGEGLAGHKFSDDHRARIAAALRAGSEFHCLKCGKPFWRKPHEIKSGHNKFCSRDCSNGRSKLPGLFDAS